jgi:hypothetical protein
VSVSFNCPLHITYCVVSHYITLELNFVYDEFLLRKVAIDRLENSTKQRNTIEYMIAQCSAVQCSAVHEIVGQEEMDRFSAEHTINHGHCCDRKTHSLKRH